MNLHQLSARDLMTSDPITIEAEATLQDAARMMRDTKMRSLIVLPSRPGQGLGILTTKDIVAALDEEDPHVLAETPVRDAMTRPAISAQQSLLIPDCIQLMRMTGVRRVPVLSGDQLVGMLSYSDVFRHVAASL